MSDELNEKRFTYVMDKLDHIDKLLVNLVNHYDDGMTGMASIRYQNQDSSMSFRPSSYTIGPAVRLITDDSRNFQIVEDKENDFLLPEVESEEEDDSIDDSLKNDKMDDGDFVEESLEAFQKRLSKTIGQTNELTDLTQKKTERKERTTIFGPCEKERRR